MPPALSSLRGFSSKRFASGPPAPPCCAWPEMWRSTRGSARFPYLGISSTSPGKPIFGTRSEEHTSELQPQSNIVCRLLLENTTMRAALRIVDRFRPDVGLGMGGYVMAPAVSTAPVLPDPYVLHRSAVRAGLATR